MNKQYTSICKIEEFYPAFTAKIESGCNSIRVAGLDPYSHLMGYLLTGGDCCITRTGHAQAMISTSDHSQLLACVKMYLKI